MPRLWILCCMAGCGVVAAAGCRPAATIDTGATSQTAARDPDRSIDARLRDVGELTAEYERWDAVTQLAWSPREPVRLRLELLRRLHDADPDRFWRSAAERFETEPVGAVVEWVCATAERDGGRDAGAAVLRRWAAVEGADPARRPEAMAFAAASGESDIEAALRAWVAGHEHPRPDRVAAWTVLARENDPATLRRWLLARPRGDPLLDDLHAAAELLDELPADREAVLWLSVLRVSHPQLWRRAVARIDTLAQTRRVGLALRHLPLLALHTAQDLATPATTDRSARVGRAEQPLAWPDRRLLEVAVAAVHRDASRAALFAQADADHADPTSEHGGLLRDLGEGPAFVAYAPDRRTHDRAFHPPAAMVWDGYTALAAYHFHAESHRNAEHAGPGSSDRRLVERTGMPLLVFTFLDRDTLHVALTLPGATLTLPPITRPHAGRTPASP